MTSTISATAFGTSLLKTNQLSDGEFLTELRWANSVPKTLSRAASQGDPPAFCSALRKHSLGTARRGGTKKASSKSTFEKPALWTRNAFELSDRAAELFDFWESFGAQSGRSAVKADSPGRKRSKTGNAKKADRKQLSEILETNPFSHPLELLILIEILHKAGSDLPDDLLFGLWRKALVAAAGLSAGLDEPEGGHLPGDQRLMILGELPWQAGLLFADLKGASRLAKSGCRFLRKELLDQTDTDGTPDAELLPRLTFWMAPLVRAAQWSHEFRAKLWNEETRERFHELVKVVAPFCHVDGRLALGNGFSQNVTSLMTSASRAAGWRKQSAPANLLQDVKKAAEKSRKHRSAIGVKRRRKTSNGEYPVTQSDWARVACLRSDWSLDSDTLIVAHHTTRPMIDLSALGEPLLAGTWDLELAVNGKPLQLDDEWTCSCWYSDEDADYLELNQALEGGVMIDRQLLLSRENHFALFADCISAAKEARIEYASRLPLLESVSAQTDPSTRECILKVNRQKARAFPLALPDDRVHSTTGSLAPVAGQLELKQIAVGGLYAPLVIDWDTKLRNSYADWRTLTVTEENRVLKSDQAAGHRLRIGKQQLFIYRRTKPSEEAHCVLGHHTTSETVIGKFDKLGDVDPILVVE